MFIDLTCPAEIFRMVLPTEEVPSITLTLFNLSDRVISSCEAAVTVLDKNGTETEKLSYRGRALNGRPHSTFMMTIPCAPEGVCAAEITIEKVWYADNDSWRRDPANAVEYTPNALPVSRALTSLQYVAGETAVGYPVLTDSLWICVCGRPNPVDSPFCARCGRQRDTVFECFTPQAVQAQITQRERQLDLNSRSMREDTIRMQRIREEEYKEKLVRRGRRRKVLCCLVLAVALCAGLLFYGAPALRLAAGRRALDSGDPAGARTIFEALGTFGGADKLIPECDWQLALKQAENSKTTEELKEASDLLRGIPDKPEAIEKANECDLMRARLLLARNDWKGAQEALALVPEDLGDRAELMRDSRLTEARALMGVEDYEAAREILAGLAEEVPEAADLASECLYKPAVAKMEEKDWDGAIGLLDKVPDYKDSRSLALQCHYRKALALEEAGDEEGAGAEYLMAGDWGDAKERVAALAMRQADRLMEAGDMKGAHALYASLPDNEEAVKKDRACRTALAKNAANDQEYSLVLELLDGVPDNYENAGELRAEAAYRKAKAAVGTEDWETAYNLLEPLDRNALRKKYKDIENLYLAACEGLKKDPYPTESPEDEATETPAEAGGPTPAPESGPAPTEDPDAETPTPVPFLVTEDDQP